MNDARAAILAAVRHSLRRKDPLPAAMADALEARIRTHPSHLRPALGNEQAVARFRRCLEKAGGTTDCVSGLDEVPAAVERYLSVHRLARELVVSEDLVLEWPAAFRVERRAARGDDAVAVTGALAGIVETGTVVVVSAARSPTTHAFLPDDHIVVLPAASIVAHIEDAWARLRELGPQMPRAVNLITGPSKTADVEQTLQTGAHGPRRFHVIVVDPAGGCG